MGTEEYKNKKPGTNYVAEIRAVRWGGKVSEWSEPFEFTTPPLIAFEAPTVTAKPFFILNQIRVSWTDVGFWKGRWDLEYYQVWRTIDNYSDPADVYANGVMVEETRSRVFIDFGYDATNYADGPEPNVPYYYYVRGVGRDGLRGKLSAYDPAELGRPDAPIWGAFTEDPNANFLFFKGWQMNWSNPSGCEGYYVRIGQKIGASTLWHLWQWVPFIPNAVKISGWDKQSHTFPNLVVKETYTFQVRSVNNRLLEDMMSTIATINSTVTDTTNPANVTSLAIAQGPVSNWLSWTQSASTDVKFTRIYKNDTGTTPATHETNVKTDLPAGQTLWIDPFSGVMDSKKWYYWIRTYDWEGNYSALSGRLVEENAVTAPTLAAAVDFLGSMWISWTPIARAMYYKVYRGSTSTFSAATCINAWCLTTFHIDLFSSFGGTWHYWVTAVTASGVESTSPSNRTSGVPTKPRIDTQVDINGRSPDFNAGSPHTSTGDFYTDSSGDFELKASSGNYVLPYSAGIVFTNIMRIYATAPGMWYIANSSSINFNLGSVGNPWYMITMCANGIVTISSYDSDVRLVADDELDLFCTDLCFFSGTGASKQTVANVPVITTTGAYAEWNILVEADLNALRTNLLALETALKAYNLIT